MATLKTTGIVLRYANYRESDRILTLFTQEHGLITASARGCRKQKSELLPAAEQFVYGDFVLFHNKDKYSLNSCDIRDTFYPLRGDMERLFAASYMLSITKEGAVAGEANPALLSLLLHSLSFCAYGDSNPLDLTLCFLIKALALLGYSPSITHCAKCSRDIRAESQIAFSPPGGGALCYSCASSYSEGISPISLEALRRMLRIDAAEMARVQLPQVVRNELERNLGEYAEYVFEKRLGPLSFE